MILTETHSIKNSKQNTKLFNKIDDYCFKSKNLRNYANYLIRHTYYVCNKLKQGEILDSKEKFFLYRMNCVIKAYNDESSTTDMKSVDATNSFIANPYFLSWMLKYFKEYKDMPISTSAQICIQNICKDWKSFYQSIKLWKKQPTMFLGRPKPPRYYDKVEGRNWIVLTNQNVKGVDANGYLIMPKVFRDIKLKPRHTNIQQVRIITREEKIIIQVLYKVANVKPNNMPNTISIDLGVNNLATVAFDSNTEPIIVDGKYLKATNQWYNREKARLQSRAKKCNSCNETKRIKRLVERRNNRVKDYMHKASRKIIDFAISNQVGLIVIGNNRGWKQSVKLGKRANQNFVTIPYNMFIKMLEYKASLVGITVKVVNESFTSGTSYLDNEPPNKYFYQKTRRKHRGLFISNGGIPINADVNGAYQIMKVAGITPPIKNKEKATRLNVA